MGLWARKLGAVGESDAWEKERAVDDDAEERRGRVRKRRRFAVKQDGCSKMELTMLIGNVWRIGGCEFPLSKSESG